MSSLEGEKAPSSRALNDNKSKCSCIYEFNLIKSIRLLRYQIPLQIYLPSFSDGSNNLIGSQYSKISVSNLLCCIFDIKIIGKYFFTKFSFINSLIRAFSFFNVIFSISLIINANFFFSLLKKFSKVSPVKQFIKSSNKFFAFSY